MGRTRNREYELLWLELTRKCQLVCGHCYADSGPEGTHGAMTRTDWLGVIGQAAALGVRMVSFIGGEPTLHPDLSELIDRALEGKIRVEVYSNLVRVTDEHWESFRRAGVSLATSYYSDDPAEHEMIVGRPTHARTTTNIAKARDLGIPVRAGLVRVLDNQRIDAAVGVLSRFGITRTGVDELRGVGRGAVGPTPTVDALCGACATGKIAVTPDGDVFPCVFARWLPVGNVLQHSLAEILASSELAAIRGELEIAFSARRGWSAHARCDPLTPGKGWCLPNCNPPENCSPDLPCVPDEPCQPDYGPAAPESVRGATPVADPAHRRVP